MAAPPRSLPSTLPTPSLKCALCSRPQTQMRSSCSTADDIVASSRLALRVGRAAAIKWCSGGLLEAAPAASCSVGSFCCHVAMLPADVMQSSVEVTEVLVRPRRVRSSAGAAPLEASPHRFRAIACRMRPVRAPRARGSVTVVHLGFKAAIKKRRVFF